MGVLCVFARNNKSKHSVHKSVCCIAEITKRVHINIVLENRQN